MAGNHSSDAFVVAISSEAAASCNTDPFMDHSAPRHTRGSLSALISAIQQAVPPPPTPAAKMTNKPKASQNVLPRRGQCTHITMNRLHGDNTCQMCGKLPEIGWLYACRQDWLVENQQCSVATAAETAIVVPDDSNYFDAMARCASSLQMSSSVVEQIRRGFYTFDQVEKLIAQKEHLISTIKRMEGLSTENTPASLHSNIFQTRANLVASLGTSTTTFASDQQELAATPDDSAATSKDATSQDTISATGPKLSQPKDDRCTYMVCHACRPFLQDRVYANIGSFVHNIYPPVTQKEVSDLPILNPLVVRGFGLRQSIMIDDQNQGHVSRPESLDMVLTSVQDGEYEDETPLEWTTSSNSSSFYDEDSHELRMLDPHPCPGPGICPVYSRNSGCAYESRGFDDGRRAINHGYNSSGTAGAAANGMHMTPDRSRARLRQVQGSLTDTPGRTSSTASSISLPTPITLSLTPITTHVQQVEDDTNRKPSKAATVCGVLSRGMNLDHTRLCVGSNMSSNVGKESFGSEVEVEGGLALTEEAVNTGVPDILTSV